MKITLARSLSGPGIGFTNSKILLKKESGGPGFWRRLPTVNGFRISTAATVMFLEFWKPQSGSGGLIVDYRRKR